MIPNALDRLAADAPRPASRVLMVEDNAIDALLVQQMLRRQGRQLFAARLAPQLPVLVMSWHVDEQQALEAVNRGAEDCFGKGDLDARALVRAIRHGVERRRSRGAAGARRSPC